MSRGGTQITNGDTHIINDIGMGIPKLPCHLSITVLSEILFTYQRRGIGNENFSLGRFWSDKTDR